MNGFLPRAPGDIQTAVIVLVDRLAPVVPVAEQPNLAREIAEVIAAAPSTMGSTMFLRQSIIRGGIATHDHVVDGLAAWVTVLFDLGNLQHDRRRALDLRAALPDEAVDRLRHALSISRNGCIVAVPHIGSIELFAAHLADREFNVGFVYTISNKPTAIERWIYAGRSATHGRPIAFGRRDTGAGISTVLANKGVVLMVVDVYPSDRYSGIAVKTHGASFRYPPGPARYARSGTLVLPGFASRRRSGGFAMNILDPVEYRAALPVRDAAPDFTQRLALQVDAFTNRRPDAFWLWHPIPADPFVAVAQQRPDLLRAVSAAVPDDEAVAVAVEAFSR
jgi:lipid A biosynthesis acyltransferase